MMGKKEDVMLFWLTRGTALVQGGAYDWGMHPMWGFWGACGIGMMFFMLLFWGLVIVGIVLGIRWLISQGKQILRLKSFANDTRAERSIRKSSRRGNGIFCS
jgi:uncharacterized membrane protein